MVDPNMPAPGIPEDAGEIPPEPSLRIHGEISDARDVARKTLDPIQRLKKLRESGEISPHAFDLNKLLEYAGRGILLRRSHLAHSTGKQAVELILDQLYALQDALAEHGMEGTPIMFIDRLGRKTVITEDFFSGAGILILLPEDLGEEEGKPALRVVG